MCVSWTDEQWLNRSQPADPRSRYTLVDTRYNQAGQIARTYSYASGNSWYAVFPGYGNHPECRTQADALSLMAAQGYNLLEKPITIAEIITEVESTPVPAEAFGADLDRSGFADLVENFA